MPDAVVDVLEVVEVEHDQRETSSVALRPEDLAPQRLVEMALVVELRQRVGLGELTRLPVPAGVEDRRNAALGEVFGRVDLVAARLPVRSAPEQRDRPQRRAVAAEERHEQASADEARLRSRLFLRAVAEADGDRPNGRARADAGCRGM